MKKILRKQTHAPRMIEIGRLYKGSPKGTSSKGRYQGGDDYGSHYLRFEPAEWTGSHTAIDGSVLRQKLLETWEGLIAKGYVDIVFPFSSIEENFEATNRLTKEIGGTTKTFVECDGETCTRWTETGPNPRKPGKTIPIFKKGSKPCAAGDDGVCPLGCSPSGHLSLIIPELYPAGIVTIPLSSIVDIQTLESELQPYRGYDLSAIPFILSRRPSSVSWDAGGEVNTKINWGLHLQVNPTIAQAMITSRTQQFHRNLFEATPQPRAIAPSEDLPATRSQLRSLSNSDDGIRFVGKIQSAIQSGSIGDVDEACEAAMELVDCQLYSASSHHFIESERDRAHEAIRAKEASTPNNPPSFNRERIRSLMQLLNVKPSILKTYHDRLGLDPESIAASVDAKPKEWLSTACSTILAEWGFWEHGAKFTSFEEALGALNALGLDLNLTTDEAAVEVVDRWLQAIEQREPVSDSVQLVAE